MGENLFLKDLVLVGYFRSFSHEPGFPLEVFTKLEYFQSFCSLLRNGALTPSYQAGFELGTGEKVAVFGNRR